MTNKGTNQRVTVPCGKCPECYKRRISGWSFRLMQEDKRSTNSLFITLTYDTENVPISKNGFMELRKRDVQLFFKSLRKRQCGNGKSPIRYYAVGEYGGRTKRPHYHAIIFNAKTELIQLAWTKGNVHYGQVSEASVGYTLKYMEKGSWRPMHRNDDRLPQFSLMSKGLGSNYMSKSMCQWHLDNLDDRMYCNLKDGKKIAMPRYYKDKIYGPTNYVDTETGEVTANGLRQHLNEVNKRKAEENAAQARLEGGKNYFRNQLEKTEQKFRVMEQSNRSRNKV